MAFAKFMAGGAGRVLRVVAGLAIIGAGLVLVGGVAGYVVAAIGLLPLAAGLFDFCLLGPLLGRGLGGQSLRDAP